jgi:hypothetical protein
MREAFYRTLLCSCHCSFRDGLSAGGLGTPYFLSTVGPGRYLPFFQFQYSCPAVSACQSNRSAT